MELEHLDAKSFEENVRNFNGKVMVDFFAAWCPPCKMLSPILEEIAGENQNYRIYKLNIDENMELAQEFGVMSVPTMILFDNGKEFDRMIGFRNKTQVLDFLNK